LSNKSSSDLNLNVSTRSLSSSCLLTNSWYGRCFERKPEPSVGQKLAKYNSNNSIKSLCSSKRSITTTVEFFPQTMNTTVDTFDLENEDEERRKFFDEYDQIYNHQNLKENNSKELNTNFHHEIKNNMKSRYQKETSVDLTFDNKQDQDLIMNTKKKDLNETNECQIKTQDLNIKNELNNIQSDEIQATRDFSEVSRELKLENKKIDMQIIKNSKYHENELKNEEKSLLCNNQEHRENIFYEYADIDYKEKLFPSVEIIKDYEIESYINLYELKSSQEMNHSQMSKQN